MLFRDRHLSEFNWVQKFCRKFFFILLELNLEKNSLIKGNKYEYLMNKNTRSKYKVSKDLFNTEILKFGNVCPMNVTSRRRRVASHGDCTAIVIFVFINTNTKWDWPNHFYVAHVNWCRIASAKHYKSLLDFYFFTLSKLGKIQQHKRHA